MLNKKKKKKKKAILETPTKKKKQDDASTFARYSNAVFIFEEYIDEGSPLQLVLPPEIVRPISDAMRKGLGVGGSLFKDAQQHVYDRLNRDYFASFAKKHSRNIWGSYRKGEVGSGWVPALATANAMRTRLGRADDVVMIRKKNTHARFSALKRQANFKIK